MRFSVQWPVRQVASLLVLSLLVPSVAAATPSEQEPTPVQAEAGASAAPAQAQSQNTDGSANGVVEPAKPGGLPDSPSSIRAQAVADNQQASGQQPTVKKQEPPAPVGTAAAQPVNTTGVAASKPAGAAIAPAKQRRTRSLLIKVGALVGAGVAVGTVMALSSASPSRPPGSR